MEKIKSHPFNVDGDFYVVDGCCTLCGIPEMYAPELFDIVDRNERYSHCFVKRQPSNDIELEQMVMAMTCSELECIRYKGENKLVQEKIKSGYPSNIELIDFLVD